MNKAQFIELVEQNQGPLRRFLTVLCGGDSFRADDIAQEALLKAYMSFEKFEGKSRFSTWLFRIGYNCFYDNRLKSSRAELEELKPIHEQNPDEGVTVGGNFEYQGLYMAIGGLPETERILVLLFYMEDKSIKEIETIMDMPSGTVRSHLSRARAHLRDYLKNGVYGDRKGYKEAY